MELWSLTELARRTSTSVAFWRKQVYRRRIAIVKVGRLVRVKPEDVATFLNAHTRASKGNGK